MQINMRALILIPESTDLRPLHSIIIKRLEMN